MNEEALLQLFHYNVSKSPFHFTYHQSTFIILTYLSLAVSMAYATHENLVYHLARHGASIAQWFERPTGILEGPGFDSETQKTYFLSGWT